MTDVSDSNLSVIVCVTHTSCCLNSYSANTLMGILFPVWSVQSESALFTVEIRTGSLLNCNIFISMGKLLSMYLSIQTVPRSTETTKFLKIQKIARMRHSSIRTCNTIVSMPSTLWLVACFRRRLSVTGINGSQTSLARFCRSRLDPSPLSETHSVGHICNAAKPRRITSL